jgi:hypothetical protein
MPLATDSDTPLSHSIKDLQRSNWTFPGRSGMLFL